jgi:hypothetical protein
LVEIVKERRTQAKRKHVYKIPKMAARTPVKPTAAVPGWKLTASLFLVEVEPDPVGVLPMLPGVDWLPAQTNLPLITLLAPFSPLKVLQELVISAEDWMLNAPRLSLRAARVTLGTY